MTNLADEAITVSINAHIELSEHIQHEAKEYGCRHSTANLSQQGVGVMRDVILQTILKSSFSNYEHFVSEFVLLEESALP